MTADRGGPSRASPYATLAWVRRRSARNTLVRLLRQRAFQAVLGIYVILAVLGVLAFLPLATSPPPAKPVPPGQLSFVMGFFGFYFLFFGAFVGGTAGSAVLTDSAAYVDSVYLAPIPHRTILRERLRFGAVFSVVFAVLLALPGADLIVHLTGRGFGPTFGWLLGVTLLWGWLWALIGLQLRRAGDDLSGFTSGALALGTTGILLALILLGATEVVGNFPTPVGAAAVAAFTTLTHGLVGPLLGFPLSTTDAAVVAALGLATLSLAGVTWTRHWRFYQRSGSTAAGLGLRVERAETGGLLERLRRRFRPRYRDAGPGDAALLGLNMTLLLRGPGLYLTGYLAAALLGAVVLVGINPVSVSFAQGVGILGVGFLLAIFLSLLVPLSGSVYLNTIATENWRGVPIAPAAAVRAALLPGLAPAAILGGLTGTFVWSLGVPPLAAAALGAAATGFAAAALMASIRAAWGRTVQPSGEALERVALPTGSGLTTLWISFFEILAFGVVVVESNSWSQATVGLAGLVVVNVSVFFLVRRSAIRAGSLPPVAG